MPPRRAPNGKPGVPPAALAGALNGETLRRLRVEDIVCDPELQMRDGMDARTVARYENAVVAGVELPPVRVAEVGGVLYLVDGWHRLAAYERCCERRGGSTEVLAVMTTGSMAEARWLAAQANLTHGLPLRTRTEKRKAFNAYVAAGKHRDGKRYKSYRELAAELPGVAKYGALRLWMKQDHPKIFAAMSTGDDEEDIERGGLMDRGTLHARAAWRRNIESAFAALEGMAPEDRDVELNRLRLRLEDPFAIIEHDASQRDASEFPF